MTVPYSVWRLGFAAVYEWKKANQRPEDHGLPPYPTGDVAGPCVCGSWPGGECLRCPVMPPATTQEG